LYCASLKIIILVAHKYIFTSHIISYSVSGMQGFGRVQTDTRSLLLYSVKGFCGPLHWCNCVTGAPMSDREYDSR